ncbi:Verruculogen synthase [Ophidiomyces ophidiicola]|nr:Verruculogen synthase [Ophidiomyces ophidiicola]KAI1933029.1 Verruculogen synthase [Ophidiomyces ophidiicola]
MTEASEKPRLCRYPVTENPETIWKTVETDGAVIVEGWLPVEVIQKFNQDLDVRSATTKSGSMNEEFYKMPLPETTKWMNDLPATCKTFRHDILNNPILHEVCKVAFKEHGDYWLLNGMAMEMAPGNPVQQLHRDQGTHPILQYIDSYAPVPAISIITALTEFTENNGATRVFPGSHRWPKIGNPADELAVRAVMKPGDALIMFKGTVHAGCPHDKGNPEHRRLLLMGMGTCQLTPYETHMTMERRIVESMTPLAQKMIGWRSVRPVISNVTGLMTVRMRHLETQIGLKSEVPLEE